MRYLHTEGYAVVTLRELAVLLEANAALPAKTVVLTFDDGFRNFYTEAFTVMSQYGFRATVFLVSDYAGKHNDWPGNPPQLPRSELLSWEEIRELHRYDIEFGSHTRTHPDLTKLGHKEARFEIRDSKRAIGEKLGREPVTFAYPFGRSNGDVREIVEDNFRVACSTNLGFVRPSNYAFLLPRLDSYYLSSQRLFERIASPGFENYLAVRQAMRNIKARFAV
jgi:peptidoglycan/xylan/chitin deacetylase (PgdA/CDA1 family)